MQQHIPLYTDHTHFLPASQNHPLCIVTMDTAYLVVLWSLYPQDVAALLTHFEDCLQVRI